MSKKIKIKEEQFLDLVREYKTINERGFINTEIESLFLKAEEMDVHLIKDRFFDALMGNICMMDDKGNMINYHCDIIPAFKCAIEDRGLTWEEWD